MVVKRYTPSSVVTNVRTPCSEGLLIVTVTPGSTPSLESLILPFSDPVAPTVCAAGRPATRANAINTTGITRLLRITRSPWLGTCTRSGCGVNSKKPAIVTRRSLPVKNPRLFHGKCARSTGSHAICAGHRKVCWHRVHRQNCSDREMTRKADRVRKGAAAGAMQHSCQTS
jgi:hypothetical protein